MDASWPRACAAIGLVLTVGSAAPAAGQGLRSITLSPADWTMGGQAVGATITLTAPAPAGGLVIAVQAALTGSASMSGTSLTSTTSPTRTATTTTTTTLSTTTTTLTKATVSSGPVTVPASVTVPANTSRVTFPIDVGVVGSETKVTITARTATGTVSTTLTVLPQHPRYVGLRVEGPAWVPEGGTGSFKALAEYDNGRTMDVTPYVSSWSLDNTVGATIQSGVVRVPAPLSQPGTALVRAVWGEPDGATRGGSKPVELRSWSVEIAGPAEVRESDFDNHLQSAAVQYSLTVVAADGSKTQQGGGIWSFQQVYGLSANILPDGTFGVYSATKDLQTEIRLNYSVGGATRSAKKQILVRYLPAKLESLKLINPPAELGPGVTHQFSAQAQLRGAPSKVVAASWSVVSAPPGTSISATGLVTTGTTAGPATVKAAYTQDGITKTATWGFSIITPTGTVSSFVILPPTPNSVWPATMWEGQTRQYKARIGFVDGRYEDVEPQWLVASPAGQISTSGYFTTSDIVSDSPVTVTAMYSASGQTRTATNDVLIRANYPTQCTLTMNGTVVSTSPKLQPGTGTQFGVNVKLADGATSSPGEGVTWEVTGAWSGYDPSDPKFATPPAVSVSATGLLTVPTIPTSGRRGTAIVGDLTVRFLHQGKSCTKKSYYTAS